MIERFWIWFAQWLTNNKPLVARLIAHCHKHPYFHIYENDLLYMARFWLVKERKWLPFAIRLHEWHMPDSGRDLHDHPCPFRTIGLRGWYIHKKANGRNYVMAAGDTAAYPAEFQHTVIEISPSEITYTLFIYWGKHQMWGFFVDGKKVPWQQYVNGRDYPDEYHKERGE